MRAPRYRFPDEVRSTTRAMASRMVAAGAVARTPEQLEAWISGEPAAKASLERGGYGTSFGAHDLLPLLDVFVVQAGGSPAVETAPPPSRRRRPVGILLALALLLLGAAAAILLSR